MGETGKRTKQNYFKRWSLEVPVLQQYSIEVLQDHFMILNTFITGYLLSTEFTRLQKPDKKPGTFAILTSMTL